MEHYLSSASLKAQAKGQLFGKYGVLIGALLLQLLCTEPLQFMCTLLFGQSTPFFVILSSAVTFLISLYSGLFSAGEAFLYLKVSCNQKPRISDLFFCFKNDPIKVIKLQAVLAGISTLAMLPASLAACFLDTTALVGSSVSTTLPSGSGGLFLLYAIFLVIGLVILVYASLVFSQCYYLMLDFPDYTAGELLKMSMQLMKGHKGRLFYIRLSFLPLMLLGLFSCCIGFLWVSPYMQAVNAGFYLDLIKKQSPR